jgi:hypothetical protein
MYLLKFIIEWWTRFWLAGIGALGGLIYFAMWKTVPLLSKNKIKNKK